MRDTLFFTKLRVLLCGWRWKRHRQSSWLRAQFRRTRQRMGRLSPLARPSFSRLTQHVAHNTQNFLLEPLEPRVLLAADLTGLVASATLPDPAVPPATATAVVQVQNIGDQRVTQSQVGVYASLDTTLDSADILLGTANTGQVNAGQSKNVSVKLTLPNTLDPVSYRLLAKVDNANAIAENNESNNVAVGGTLNVAWQFGAVPGQPGITPLTLTDADGTKVTFNLVGPGIGTVIPDGSQWDVRVAGTTAASILTIQTTGGGNGRVTLNDLTVLGPLGILTATTTQFTGTLAINGTAQILSLGPVDGGTVAVASVQTFEAAALTNATVLIGATLGADGQLGGTGAAADTFQAGAVSVLKITGPVTSSSIRVGVDPVDGIFGNGNDGLLGGASSRISTLTIGGVLSADSRIIAGALPATALINGQIVRNLASLPQFSTDVTAPVLTAALAHDTGASATDQLTSNPTIIGILTDNGTLASFTAGFGATPTFNILPDRQANGAFTLTPARLAQIQDAPLTDGPHTLTLRATDGVGHSTQVTVSFTLDTSVAPLSLDLHPGSDTAPVGDQQTTQELVTLTGQTEPHAGLELLDGLLEPLATTTADAAGLFTFPNVALALGANTVTARATDLAGNQQSFSRTITRTPIQTTVRWINPNGGDWHTVSNWSTGVLPTADQDVIIDIAVTNPITHTAGTTQIKSLTSTQPLALAGGIVNISGDFESGNPVSFTGGSVSTAGDQIYNANVVLAANTTLSGNDITFNANVNGSPHTLTLNMTGAITQMAGFLTAETLTLSAQTGITLTNIDVSSLAAMNVTGAVVITEVDGLTLNAVSNSNGSITIATAGSLVLNGNVTAGVNTMTLTSGASISQLAGTLTAGTAFFTAKAGINLTSGSIAHLAATNNTSGNISITTTGPLNVDVGGVRNNATTGDVSLATNGTLTLTGDVTVQPERTISLSGRTIAQTGGDPIADTLVLTSVNGATLTNLVAENLSAVNTGSGVILVSVMGDLTIIAPGLANAGGNLMLTVPGDLTVRANVSASEAVRLNVTGDLINEETLSLGMSGQAIVTGGFTNSVTGVVDMDIGGTTLFGRLLIAGPASLDGTLDVTLVDGFVPAPGDRFQFMTFGSRTGSFSTTNLPANFAVDQTDPTDLELVVATPNQAPVLAPIGNQTIDEGQTLTFTATASDADEGQTLTFSLDPGSTGQVPTGATINPTTGVFSWTPTEAQGPGTYTFDVVVTDGGTPALSDSETITVMVNPGERVVNGTGNDDVLTLKMVSGELSYTLNGNTVGIAGATSFRFNGGGGNDMMTVDYSGGFFSIPVTFEGESQATGGGDKLVVMDGTFTDVEHTFTGSGGNLRYDTADGGASADASIVYTGLESVDITGSAIASLVFNLPGTIDQAILEDDSTPSNGISQVRSRNGVPTFDTTSFSNPTSSLTVNMGGDTGTFTVASLPDFTKSLTINGQAGSDNVNFTGTTRFDSLAVTAGGSITDSGSGLSVVSNASFTGSSITLDGATNDFSFLTFNSSGGVTLVDSNSIALGGSSTAGSLVVKAGTTLTMNGTIDIAGFADLDATDGNLTLNGDMSVADSAVFESVADIVVNGNLNVAENAAFFPGSDGSGSLLVGHTSSSVVNFGTLTFVAPNEVTIVEDSDTVFTGESTASSLVLTSAGSITDDADADIHVVNNASLRATGAIMLGDQVGNVINSGTLTFISTGGVNISEDSNSEFTGNNRAGNDVSLATVGSLTVNGSVDPGTSSMRLTAPGGVVLTASAVVNIEVGGTASNEFTVISIPGSVTLDGTLDVDLVNDFVPAPGDRFQFMTFGSRTGSFSTTNLPANFAVDQTDPTDLELVVATPNQAPVLAPIGNQTIDENDTLTFTASATDADVPTQALTFSLVNAPNGAAIDSATGEFTWTPTEAQGPGSYTFDVVVIDDGTLAMSDRETLTITVHEVNQAPVLAPIGNQSVQEGETLTFQATATDSDFPANSLTFSLVNAPSGATIDPATGVFRWTPTAAPNSISFTASPAFASLRITETQLTVDRAADFDAAVSGADVVFATHSGGNLDVVHIGLSGIELPVTIDPADQDAPDVDAGRVVWVDRRFGNPDLFLRDLATGVETPLVLDREPDLQPALSGDNLIFIAMHEGVAHVVWHQLSTGVEQPLTFDSDAESAPSIDGDLVAWQVVRGDSVDIMAVELGGTPFVVAGAPEHEVLPSVSAGRIAYIANGDVFLYDHASGDTVQVTADAAAQQRVVLDGDHLFWSDDSSGNVDIYLHHLGTGDTYALTSDPADQVLTDADGGRVVYHDNRFGDLNVWMTTFSITRQNAFTFDLVVADDGNPSLRDSESITVMVNEENSSPLAVDDSFTVQQNSTLMSGTANG
ncbi:MAG: putative Ig domain-containing protein [Nitrospira sp.]|nr:putative Ig domain-containing protein [Nitrospira sp.]